jgi:hypothetical protein
MSKQLPECYQQGISCIGDYAAGSERCRGLSVASGVTIKLIAAEELTLAISAIGIHVAKEMMMKRISKQMII